MKKQRFSIRFIVPMLRKDTFRSLFLKNLLYLLVIVAVPLISLTLFINFSYINSRKQELYSNINKNTIEFKAELKNEVNQIKTASYALAYDKSVIRLATHKGNRFNNDFLKIINDIKMKLKVYETSYFITADMGIMYLEAKYNITSHTSYSLKNFEYRESDFLKNIYDTINDNVQYNVFLSDYGIISICLLNNKESRGVVYTLLNFNSINSSLKKYMGEGLENYYLIDRQVSKMYTFGGDVSSFVYNKDKTEDDIISVIHSKDMEQITIADKEYIIKNIDFPNNYISLVMLVDASNYMKHKQTATLVFIFMLIIIICVSILASSYVSWRFYQPIDFVIHLLQNPKPNVVNEYKEAYEPQDELGIIYTMINETRFREAMLKDELQNKKDILNRIQNKLLQSQINPHFINNTLETINWKSIDLLGEDNDISEMLVNFSKLLSRSFRDAGQMVPISSELEHAKLYLDFQQRRFLGKFEVEWDIDKRLLHYYTVPIILQPLLENAIKYGIKPLKNAKGLIRISCQSIGERIEFVIYDYGTTISNQQFNHMRNQLKIESLNADNHIGISNVQQRIKLAFGDHYGLEIDNGDKSSLEINKIKVMITIPTVKKSTL